MTINGKEAKHIVIRNANGDDVIYIGENEIINQSEMSIHISDENHGIINIKEK